VQPLVLALGVCEALLHEMHLARRLHPLDRCQ
jgi:hypothetical protein